MTVLLMLDPLFATTVFLPTGTPKFGEKSLSPPKARPRYCRCVDVTGLSDDRARDDAAEVGIADSECRSHEGFASRSLDLSGLSEGNTGGSMAAGRRT